MQDAKSTIPCIRVVEQLGADRKFKLRFQPWMGSDCA
jgi:hypothetical protein